MLLDFRKLGVSSINGDQTLAQRYNDNELLISVGQDCIIYEIAEEQAEWYYSSGSKYNKNSGKSAKYSDLEIGRVLGQFCLQGEYLWRAGHGHGTCCYKMDNGNIDELFFYPPFEEKSRLAISRLFPCPNDKSVFLIRGSDILKLTPQESVK